MLFDDDMEVEESSSLEDFNKQLKVCQYITEVTHSNEEVTEKDNIVSSVTEEDNETCTLLGKWPPEEGEFIIGVFEDEFYPGEVLSILDNSEARIAFLAPKVINGYTEWAPWVWPVKYCKYEMWASSKTKFRHCKASLFLILNCL